MNYTQGLPSSMLTFLEQNLLGRSDSHPPLPLCDQSGWPCSPPLLPTGQTPKTPVALVARSCPLPRWLIRQTLGGEWTHYPSIYCQRCSHIEIKLVTDPQRKWIYFCSEQHVGGDLSVPPTKQPVPDGLRVQTCQAPLGFSAALLPSASAPRARLP